VSGSADRAVHVAPARTAAGATPARRSPAPAEASDSHHAGPGHRLADIAVAVPDGAPVSPGRPVPRDRGQPIAGPERASFTSLLGASIPDVRIHRGPDGWPLADALGVRAFTVGTDIVLGRGVDEASPAGRRLVAHELAHAVQQAGAPERPGPIPRTDPGGAEENEAHEAAAGRGVPRPRARLAIAGAGPDVPVLPRARRFHDLWPEFEQAAYGLDVPRATAIARQLATAPYDFPDLLEHGIHVVTWLDRHGEPDAAKELQEELRRVWLIEFVSRDSKLPSLDTLSWDASDPTALITLGEEAARAGRHPVAFSYLGLANEVLSYYAMQASEKRQVHLALESSDEAASAGGPDAERERVLRESTQFPRLISRTFQYGSLQKIYDQMRRIYTVYPRLEREAIGAGDAAAATAARAKASELQAEIRQHYTWGTPQGPAPIGEEVREPVEIAEVSLTDTQRGPGLTLHGANGAETDLTPLPGLPSPKEVGDNVQVQNLANLQQALMAQADLQAELGRVPEIRAAFGDRPIDLTDQATRQRVWLIAFRSLRAAGPAPLGALMALIGRYLRAFTIHTTYNVRDWGVSYLDSKMPTDLAGRTEQDCGVYALTVAWDVYQTAKRGDPGLDLTFELITMLEHVTLIITDRAAGEFYLVNNDAISGPLTGQPDRELSKAYGGVRQLGYAVGPSVPVGIGSTRDAPRTFHDQAWTRYRAATDWGLDTPPPPDVEALRRTNPAEFARRMGLLEKERYERFYRDQQTFSELMARLDPILDGLTPSASDAGRLGSGLDARIDGVLLLVRAFIDLGPKQRIAAGSAASRAVLPNTSRYLYTLPAGRTVHPLARFAMALHHLHRLGRVSTAKETAYLAEIDRIDDFRDAANAYLQAGANGPF
jgi:Domain of unknown function (DUF4157)